MQLARLSFEVSDLAAWQRFGVEVLGLELAGRLDGGGFALGMPGDDHVARFHVTPGPADDLAAIGLEVDALPSGEKRVLLRDPSGVPVELVARAPRRPATPGGFVAGDLGLGHVVLGAEDREASRRFYEGLGFRLSDRVVAEIHGHHADLLFLHCNPRHHTIALGARQPKRLHHFMVEARSVDDVGLALDRTLAAGLRVMHTLGRHPNDRMLSFYAMTPSGFQFEYGWGARLVDDATWTPEVHDRISEWGHHPPALLRGPR
jgi:2,3-dihydroxybiphenyl 1,2-dioxygenase